MAITKFNPDFNDFIFPRVSTMLDNFFNRDIFDSTNFSSGSLPAVNIKETKDEFLVELAAPGMSKEDFKVELDHNALRISSEKKQEHEEKARDGKYSRREFSYQSFQRTFTLPHTVENDKISATYKEGILRLSIPKKEEAKEKPARVINIS
ncbi:MAG: Hsp20/alpha crystallin family protein [Bacteroidia bacterium]|nr:Hsp20/alpha crystallin family protein [Bacteroidia bacterium]